MVNLEILVRLPDVSHRGDAASRDDGTDVGATATWSLLSPRQYTATASVVLDVKSPDPVSGMMLAGLMAPGYMATQVDIIKSDRVARRVRSEEHTSELQSH